MAVLELDTGDAAPDVVSLLLGVQPIAQLGLMVVGDESQRRLGVGDAHSGELLRAEAQISGQS